MRAVAGLLLAVTMGCTPLCKEYQSKTVYHQECRHQSVNNGVLTGPLCVTHIEHVEIVTEKPVQKED